MNTLEDIRARRSVRDFTDAPVSQEQVDELLHAAMAAPSAGNQQTWRFVIVRDRETLDKLAVATPYGKPMGKAPLGIVVLAEPSGEKFPGNWPNDCAAATENILIAAHALGLGACWLGVHPGAEREAAVGALVGAPEGYRVFSMIAVGTPDAPGPKPDRYDEAHVRAERWSE